MRTFFISILILTLMFAFILVIKKFTDEATEKRKALLLQQEKKQEEVIKPKPDKPVKKPTPRPSKPTFNIPGDKGIYAIEDVWKDGSITHVINSRISPLFGKEYFSKHVNCSQSRYKYVVDGATSLQQVRREHERGTNHQWSKFIRGSISHHISERACGRKLVGG